MDAVWGTKKQGKGSALFMRESADEREVNNEQVANK